MKRFIVFAIIILVAVGVIFSIKPQVIKKSVKPQIAVTIFPLADIARSIFGDQIDVVQLLPIGSSEHTFELTPQQAVNISNISVLFYIGQGLDDNWAAPVLKSNTHIKATAVSVGITLIASMEADEPGNDPHYWLSYDNAPLIAKTMLSAVIKQYPDLDLNKLQSNLSTWLNQVAESKLKSHKLMDAVSVEKKNIITFHDGWRYFAKEFGLNIAGVFEEFAGKEPSPQDLIELQKTIKENNIKIVFSEPQFSPATLQSLATDLGLEMRELDPMGGTAERDTFINLMEYNVSQITR